MTEIEKAFEAGYRAYREAFDHYDDNDSSVERSLKWRMTEYVEKIKKDEEACPCDGNHDPDVRCEKCGLRYKI